MTTITLCCKFHPQAWQNDYAVDVDPEGETRFMAPWPATAPLPDDGQYESDYLRYADGVPQWIADWGGPFYVEITNRDECEPTLEESP